ncbi:MAG: Copper-exporting P-type ATPase A [Tenericutes bacterium ADurb.BinA155]|nr:MAG: Copper-exporting P-type ATPase A [Tenericutes bacterium ADurb.BinA155]
MKKKFNVTGMSCAACQANVTRAVDKVEGVTSANVSLLGKSMVVDFDETKTDESKIIAAVGSAGYGASPYVNQSIKAIQEQKKRDLRKKRSKLLISFIFLVLLLFVSMGGMIAMNYGWPNHQDSSYPLIVFLEITLEILFVTPIIVINFHYFISGYKALFKAHPNMDSLVALGSTVSLLYGLFAYIMIIVGWALDDHAMVMAYAMNIYIESAGTILFFVSLGKYFENKATNKTTASIAELMSLTPDTAYRVQGSTIEEVPTGSLEVGDIVLVKPGEAIPTDGILSEGYANIDESLLTGESLPVYKKVGDRVIGGSLNKTGSFQFKVTSVGKDTTMSKIVALVEQASESKAPIARLADKISLVFVPTVILISLITFTAWMLITGLSGSLNISLSIQLAISVLVISCPCALGLATPVAIMVGTGKGAENGILIKSAEAFELMEKADYVLFDKTGTLTTGEMTFHQIKVFAGDEDGILKNVAAVESLSEHPLSKAIVAEAKRRGLTFKASKDFVYEPGLGVKGNGYLIGNKAMMAAAQVSLGLANMVLVDASLQGDTALYVAKAGKLLAIISIGDELKPHSVSAVATLRKLGKKVALVTGDNKDTARAISEKLGIDEVYSEVLPNQKEAIVSQLQSQGFKVAFVGDGVNDAPSLTKADIGIAIGAGSDIAIDSADIILVHSDPLDVVSSIELSHAVVKNIKENLLWAFFYNVILIPLAAGVLYNVQVSWGHFILTPTIASIAMSLSSVTVVLNALRLRLFKRKVLEKEAK